MRGGPGFMVAAAFIGPGTVTATTLAGVAYGTTLLWALVFATLAATVLQEMSARLGLVTRRGLVEALGALAPPWGRLFAWASGLAVLLGIVAFQAGNLTGAGLGLAAVAGTDSDAWTLAVAVVATGLLCTGRYRLLEQVLTWSVAVMGVLFLSTAVWIGPDPGDLLGGLLVPQVPQGATLIVLALIGTTVVPYNLFLHAGAVRARWRSAADVPAARRDLVFAVTLGGLVSASIVITASAALSGREVASATDMAAQLEPLLGPWAGVAFASGFALAGLTSAITAPLAAAYVVCGLTGSDAGIHGGVGRAVAAVCVLTGTVIALAGVSPVRLILWAQAANGVILPLVAVALLLALNDRKRLGSNANGWRGNLLGSAVVAVCLLLAFRA